MNNKGKIPKIPNIPALKIFNVSPLKINNNIWPAKTLAANLSPKDIFLAKKEIVSINTKNGNRNKGHPTGTNNPKNLKLCIVIPSKIVPITIVKLQEKASIKWLVVEKLYGISPIKLFISININNAKINGKYNCPLNLSIWFTTTLFIVS